MGPKRLQSHRVKFVQRVMRDWNNWTKHLMLWGKKPPKIEQAV
jgi:hypothetical protein